MPRHTYDLLNLDIEKLFEEKKVDEIIEIEKMIEAEIERKRLDLRSMVGCVFLRIVPLSLTNLHLHPQRSLQRCTDCVR